MIHSRPIYIYFFFLLLIAACEAKQEDKLDSKNAPFEHFYFQRSFPDATLDYRMMEKSLKKTREFYAAHPAKSENVEWTQEGPLNVGGRINVVAVHPTDNNTWITGTAGGGAYRTTDAGQTWEPLSEELTHLPVGDIVYDPTNPDIIYMGTGDVNIGGTVYIGNGVFKSEDGGDTWNYIGLEESRIVSKIAVNPLNPEQIFVATMGVPFEENTDRGLYRSNDGGNTWEQVLFVTENAGIIDLVMNPENPSILYAASWNRIRTNLFSLAAGEDAAIYRSTDGGENWEVLNGLPEGPMSRIGLHLWEGDPSTLFALYVNPDYDLEGIYKSEDGGDTFSEIPTSTIEPNVLGGFGWYFGKIAVNPANDAEISVLGVDLYTTQDNGNTWFMSTPPWFQYTVHADKHDMEYLSPTDVLLATDGGLYRSTDGLQTWSDVDLIPNTQFYRIATSPFDSVTYYGGAQDNGTSTQTFDEEGNWVRFFGGDGFQPIPDPINPDYLYVMTQNGRFWFIDYGTFDVFELNLGYPSDERVNWDAPFIMDHEDNTILMMARERVYRMEDAPFGTWEAISPSLVDPSPEFASRRNISTIGQSAVNGSVIYAGTSDGKAWVTNNAGDTWTEISDGLPGYYVTDVKASPFNEATVLISVSGYRNYDETPHLYLSSNFGEDWIPVTGDLPEMPVNHIEILDETTWFIATDNGVYYTENSGVNWNRLGANFPYVVVTDLAIEPSSNRLIAGTYGVSMLSIDLDDVLDDISVGLKEQYAEKLKIYPNPAGDFIQVNEFKNEDAYRIFDLNGRSVKAGNFQNLNGRLNINELPNGTYVLIVGEGVAKFVVSR